MREREYLPENLLRKASVSEGGECAWKQEDVSEVINAAKRASVVNLGGQPQFQGPIGTSEPYWLNFGPSERNENEAYSEYVERAATETLAAFQHMVNNTNFIQVGVENWEHIREANIAGMDILNHLWFVLYFDKSS
ncbi:hypothetical protein OAM69_06215 [bacterium]|nr:hypothetical protein [bacterium]